jgi:hypothetical protein
MSHHWLCIQSIKPKDMIGMQISLIDLTPTCRLIDRENDSLHEIRFYNVQRCASKNSTVIASFSSHSTPNQEW